MKKALSILIVSILSIILMSCQEITYDDIFLDYTNYLEDQQTTYNERLAMFQTLNEEVILAMISIESDIPSLNSVMLGSGVIYDEDEDYYYALTNSHVIGADMTYSHIITVTDVFGNEYDAALEMYDASYDLAMIRFSKGDTSLYAIPMHDDNLAYKVPVIVLGHPDGQVNAITMGSYLDMRTIDVERTSVGKIEFPVMQLDVPVQSGSSGSVVVDEDFVMVGLIFAGSFVENTDDIIYSYAVPIESVHEFLNVEADPS